MVIFSISSAKNSGPHYKKLDWKAPSFIFKENNRYSLNLLQERIILHIANDHVGKEETIFFKGYLSTAFQQKEQSVSGVLNVELLNGNGAVIKRQFNKVADGIVEGHLELPKNIAPGI